MSDFPTLDKYLPNFRTIITENEWKNLTSSVQDRTKNIKRYINKLLRENDGLERAEQENTRFKEVSLDAIKEIKAYAKKEGWNQRVSGTIDQNIVNLFNAPTNKLSHVKYNGEKIKSSDIVSEEFDANLLSLDKIESRGEKIHDFDEIKQAFMKKFNDVSFGPMASQQKYIKKNIINLIKQLKKEQKGEGLGAIRGELRAKLIIDMNIESVFNARTMKNFQKREDAYEYWENIGDKIGKLQAKLKNLAVLLEKTKDDTPEITNLLKFIRTDLPNINYITEFEPVSIQVKDMDMLAYEAFESFLNVIGGLMKIEGEDSVIDIVSREFKTEEGGMQRDIERDEDVREDTLPQEIKNAKSTLNQETPLDPLAIIYFRKELKELGVVNTNLVSLKEKMREYFDDLTEQNEYPDLQEEDAEALFENFIDELDDIEDLDLDAFLPVFMAEDDALSKEYKQLTGKASNVKEGIKDFLLVFKEFLELDKSTISSKVNLTMLGVDGSPLRDREKSNKDLTVPWFSYGQFIGGSKGNQRFTSDKENIKDAKNLSEEISVTVNQTCKLIADCFLLPQFSPYRAGIDLPFSGDFTLRLIAATRPLSQKYKAITKVNQRLLERDSSFINKEQVDDILNYLKVLAGANNIKEYTELYSKSEDFANSLQEIYDDDSMDSVIDRDVASILGSIFRLLDEKQKEDAKSTGLNKFNGVNVISAYSKINKDDPTDIYAIQALVEAIRSRKGNLSFRVRGAKGKGDNFDTKKVKDILFLLDKVSKSSVQRKLLEVHDTLRILKSKPVIHSMKNEDNFDHMDMMITKMENEYNIDMSANEIINIIKTVDSFENIANDYGVDSEIVYVVKANFR